MVMSTGTLIMKCYIIYSFPFKSGADFIWYQGLLFSARFCNFPMPVVRKSFYVGFFFINHVCTAISTHPVYHSCIHNGIM